MKNHLLHCVVLCLLLCYTPRVVGQGSCSGSDREFVLNANTIRASFYPGGKKFTNGNSPGFLVPYPSAQKLSTIFASSPWIGGFDDAGILRLAADRYFSHSNTDFSVGPLTPYGVPIDSTCEYYNYAWSVNGDDIWRHIVDFETDLIVDDTIQSIFLWPARGNKYFEEFYGFALPLDNQGLAPFHDRNGNNIYEPAFGDHPVVYPRSTNLIIPEQMLWTVFNDVDEGDSIGARPLRFEIQLTAYAFYCQDNPVLNNTIFNSYKILNRAVTSLDSVFFGMWTDYALGCSADDCIGSDSSRNTEFVYNADMLDGDVNVDCSTGATTYGNHPPIQSLTYLSHPMHSFISDNNNVVTPIEMYRRLTGRWEDNTVMTPEGNGYNPGSVLPATKFLFHGDPRDTAQWSDVKHFPNGGERRTVSSVSLGRMDPGAIEEVHIAYMYHDDPDADHLEQFAAMYRNIDSLPSYLSNIRKACTPFPYCGGVDCVWPGDFDHNGIADHHDYLSWGAMLGKTGPPRNGQVNWRGHIAENWSNSGDGINAKHADGDGNGIVNDIDINVIHEDHYLKTTPEYIPEVRYPPGDDLVLSSTPFDEDGNIDNFSIRAGHILENVLGISFDVEFDTSLFNTKNAFLAWPVQSPHLSFYHGFNPSEFIHFSTVQTNNTAISVPAGFGFLRIPINAFSLKDGATMPDSTIIRLRNLKGIDADGNNLHLGSFPLIVYRDATNNSFVPEKDEVLFYPNPADEEIIIISPVRAGFVVFNVQGQIVKRIPDFEQSMSVDVSGFPAGMYFLKQTGSDRIARFFKK